MVSSSILIIKKDIAYGLVGASPIDLRSSNFIHNRIENVRQFRLNAPKKATQDWRIDLKCISREGRQPNVEPILLCLVFFQKIDAYIPMGFNASRDHCQMILYKSSLMPLFTTLVFLKVMSTWLGCVQYVED